jgi:tetratricopeptide (TPR) repeat protein
MSIIQTLFEIPNWITQGIYSGEYIRIGGVIREAKSKRIVAILREVLPDISKPVNLLAQISSVASVLNLGISVLNLGVSVVGFSLLLKKISEVENSLKDCFKEELGQVQDNINHLHRKIDISVYADFKAAINLACEATTVIQTDIRKSMIISALMELLKSKNVFSDYLDDSLKGYSTTTENNIIDKYILTLLLVYITRARCYLELEEINNAIFCLQEGANFIYTRAKQYVKNLLISEAVAKELPSFPGGPIIYLDSPVELYRLAQICKLLEPELSQYSNDKSILFAAQGQNLIRFIPYKYEVNTAAVHVAVGVIAGTAIDYNSKAQIDNSPSEELASGQNFNPTTIEINADKLLNTLENIEQIIETYNRFETYLIELQLIQNLGMSFQNWLQLTPDIKNPKRTVENIYIIVSETLNLN